MSSCASCPTIAEHGAVLILDDFHLVDESPDVRLIARELVARAPGAAVDRLRQPADAADPARPAARLGRGRRARDGRPPVRRCRDGAALLRDVRARARTRRPRRRHGTDRRLGGLAPARPGRAPRSDAGRDPPVRPEPDRRRPGALRLPRRGGRRRPAGRPAAVPDADLDPPGRHAGARRGRHRPRRGGDRPADRGRRAPDAPDPAGAHVTRPAALPPARARVPRGPPAVDGRRREAVAVLHRRAAEAAAAIDWRVAAYHYREAGDLDAVATTIAAAIPEIMGSGQHAAAVEEIDRIPDESRLPVLSLVTSRIQMQRRDYEPAIDAVAQRSWKASNPVPGERLRPPEPDDDRTSKRHWNESRELAQRLREIDLKRTAPTHCGWHRLMIDATSDGSIDAMRDT